jgi:hypothetical protein
VPPRGLPELFPDILGLELVWKDLLSFWLSGRRLLSIETRVDTQESFSGRTRLGASRKRQSQAANQPDLWIRNLLRARKINDLPITMCVRLVPEG